MTQEKDLEAPRSGEAEKVWHVTTPKKLARYKASGGILPHVRFWRFKASAEAWAKKTGRTVILELPLPERVYPLPDHQPPRHAWWTDSMVSLSALAADKKEGKP